MPVITREREGDEVPSTETDPMREEVPEVLEVGDPAMGNSVTIIENLSANGYIGYLFAQHLRKTHGGRRWEGVHYLRFRKPAGVAGNRIFRFNSVDLHRGYDDTRKTKYDYLVTGSDEILLQPTTTPYIVCDVHSGTWDKWILYLGEPRNVESILREVNFTLAQQINGFSLNPNTQALILPENYASFKME